MYDAIIVGAGPAGVVAANLMSRKGLKILIIEKGKDLLRRRDMISGFFGRALFGMYRLKLHDPALRNKKTFKEALTIVQNVAEWHVDLAGKDYCEPHADCARELAAFFYDQLIDHVDISFSTEVITIKKGKEILVITNKGVYKGKRCIIATGRCSMEWLKKVCDDLQIDCRTAEAEIGVRVELPAHIVRKNIDTEKDMETSNWNCSDISQKSFVAEWEESGMLSAAACNLPDKRSDRTSFMVGFKPRMEADEIIRTVKITNVLANDKIRRERLQDYMEKRSIIQNLEVFNGLYETFVELHDAIPSFINYAMMYIPEIKLFGILPVNAKMKTGVAGIYGAGECTTRATTILGAMASGLIVARTILGE